jgi:DNA-binding transcriptional LysR family regulator
LVCVHHLSSAAEKILENGVFCVNVLRDDQGYISDTFAGRFRDQIADKFDCATWVATPSGAPRVVDPLVGFDCTVVSSNRVGTHYVFFGEVGEVFAAGQGSPLIYANRAYGAATRIDSAASISAGQEASGNTLSVGCFHTFGPYILPEMIQRMRDVVPGVELSLVEGDQRRVQESLLAGEVEVALMYAFEITADLEVQELTRLPPYVLLAEGHPLAEKAVITPADLAGQPMILLDTSPSRNYFTGILRAAGVEPKIAFRSSNFEMVRGMVGHGQGYAILSTKPAASMSYDGRALTHRPLQADFESSRVVLATRQGHVLSPPAEQFVAFCRDFFDLDD